MLTVAALMAAMMVASALPAFASHEGLSTATYQETKGKNTFTCTATYLDNDHSGTLTEGDEVLDVSCVRSK